MYYLQQEIQFTFQLTDANYAAVIGKVIGNFRGVMLRRDGTVDCSSLLSLNEVGAGEYYFKFIPVVAGHYTLLFTDPIGTLEYQRSNVFEVVNSDIPPTAAISSLYDIVVSNIKQIAPLAAEDINDAIAAAIVGMFSTISPKMKAVTITGTGLSDVNMSVQTSFLLGFSELKSIEYPMGDVPPTLLFEDVDYSIIRSYSEYTVHFLEEMTTENFRFVYTVLHAADGSDLNAYELRQVSYLAAGFALEKIASFYLKHTQTSVGDAAAEFRSRSDEAAARSREYFGLFYAFFGGDGKSISPTNKPVLLRVQPQEPVATAKFRFTHR